MNIIIKKIYEERLLITSWVVLILSILTTYANYNEFKDNIQVASFFTSDSLGLPSLYKDLFLDNGSFKDWTFATAPTLFPDILLYFFLIKVFSFNFLTAALVYGLIQVSALTFLCIYIYKKLVPDNYKSYKWLVPLFISFVFIESFYFTNDLFFGFLFLTYSFHTGSFLNCLIFISVFVSDANKIFKYLFFLLFTALAVFSDRLFIVMLIAPLFLTYIFTFKQVKEYKYSLLSFLFISLGSVAALRFYQYINLNKFAIFQDPHKMYAFNEIIPSVKIFFEQMLYYSGLPGLRGFVIIFTFFSLIFILFYILKNFKKIQKNNLTLAVFYFFFLVCVFSAPLINGNYTGWDTLRYNIAPFFFSSVVFALFIAFIFKGRSDKISQHISLCVLIFFFVLVAFKFNTGGFKNYLHFYPKQVAEIDSVAAKYHLKRGISEYWTAKKTTMFSKNNVKIFSVYENTAIQELGANLNWFFDKEFDFVVADKMAPAHILQRFTIKDTIKTSDYTILIVDPFTYPKAYFPEKLKH